MSISVEFNAVLDKVVSSRKTDGIEGQIVLKWNVGIDFERFARLAAKQQDIVVVTIADQQFKMNFEPEKKEKSVDMFSEEITEPPFFDDSDCETIEDVLEEELKSEFSQDDNERE